MLNPVIKCPTCGAVTYRTDNPGSTEPAPVYCVAHLIPVVRQAGGEGFYATAGVPVGFEREAV